MPIMLPDDNDDEVVEEDSESKLCEYKQFIIMSAG